MDYLSIEPCVRDPTLQEHLVYECHPTGLRVGNPGTLYRHHHPGMGYDSLGRLKESCEALCTASGSSCNHFVTDGGGEDCWLYSGYDIPVNSPNPQIAYTSRAINPPNNWPSDDCYQKPWR
eukprot:gene8160-2825_t